RAAVVVGAAKLVPRQMHKAFEVALPEVLGRRLAPLLEVADPVRHGTHVVGMHRLPPAGAGLAVACRTIVPRAVPENWTRRDAPWTGSWKWPWETFKPACPAPRPFSQLSLAGGQGASGPLPATTGLSNTKDEDHAVHHLGGCGRSGSGHSSARDGAD